MTIDDVNDVLACLGHASVVLWLDGGWGVDALLGRQTRSHSDLDVVIDRRDLPRALASLGPFGFSHADEVRPGLPARFVLRDPAGRQIDFHPVAFDELGNGWQDLGGGTRAHYPATGLAGRGTIGGRTVQCVTPELQVQHHLGYNPDRQDIHDMRLLAERFPIDLPPPLCFASAI